MDQAPIPTPTEEMNNGSISKCEAQAKIRWFDKLWFRHPGAIERLTGWLVLWTACLFFATILSVIILWRTDRTLHETIEASNRAWVSVVEARLDSIPAKGVPILGGIVFQNTGKSPALQVNYMMFIQGLPADAKETLQDDVCRSVPPGASAIFPSEKHAISFPYGKEGVPTSDVMEGKTIFFWRGCFTYETFERRHHTRFCYYLRHSGPSWHWQDCGMDAD
jgi:hypothetical protein